MTNSNENFNTLVKDKSILKAIEQMGITIPTEIQIKTIPLILEGKNIIAESATGTGKTIAFLSGILSNIEKRNKVQCLIIVPTRELALQVFEEVKKMSVFKKISSCAVYGGESISDQARELKSADVVIGTPGRLIDQTSRGSLKLGDIKYLVLDEADRMCDMGFFEDISKIIDKIPKERQTLLFSATITKDVSILERKYLSSAIKISVESKVDPSNLLQEYYIVKPKQKFSLLIHLIKENNKKSIIFSNTRREVDVIYNNLVRNGVEAFKLHGGLEQRKRTHTINKYHTHKSAVLISSDVSARGIHVDNLEFIYNYDFPKEDNQYIHRIGRTARAGKKGKAIALIHEKEEPIFLKMCKRFGFKVEKKELPVLKDYLMDRGKGKVDNRSGPRTSRKNDFFTKQLDFLKTSGNSSRGYRDSRGPPRGPPRDRDSRGPVRGPARDRDSRGPVRGPARDRDSRGPARGPPRDRNSRGPPRDRDSRGPVRDRDSQYPKGAFTRPQKSARELDFDEKEKKFNQKRNEDTKKQKIKFKQKKYLKKR
jgi:ATP-dependent RNA helicase DeaD